MELSYVVEKGGFRLCGVVLFVCAFGLSALPSVRLVLSFFLNFCTFASREGELRAPYGRRGDWVLRLVSGRYGGRGFPK